MKCLVVAECGFSDPRFGVMLERAECLQASGAEVTFAYCNGCLDVCFENAQGSRCVCWFCHFVQKHLMKRLSSGIRKMPLRKRCTEKIRRFEYSNLSSLRALRYKGVWIGYAVLSAYISATRNSRPDLSTMKVRKYIDHRLNLAADMADLCEELLSNETYDEIHVYNGRLADNRAFYDMAVGLKLRFFSNEVIGNVRTHDDYTCITYRNGLPHNLFVNKEMAESLWKMPDVSFEEKVRIATEFYEHRRGGVAAGDRIYTGMQIEGKLPDGYDSSKRNIVVFNSSEDEFSAIGKDFDDYQLFATQTDGIVYLLDHLPCNEYHVYVRMHPNLARVKYEYVRELFDLPKKYSNLTLISPDDAVSTYALVDVADKVVVFGSTIGAESTYWGKPVILAGPSFYYFLDVAYVPKTKGEFLSLIVQAELPPKEKLGTLKFAYFLLERNRLASPGRFFDFHNRAVKLFGTTFYITAYSSLWGSLLLMKLVRILFVYGTRRFGAWPLPDAFFTDHCYESC